jgi:hypothetical protein
MVRLKKTKNITQDSQSPGREINPGFPEEEADLLTTPSRRFYTKTKDNDRIIDTSERHIIAVTTLAVYSGGIGFECKPEYSNS